MHEKFIKVIQIMPWIDELSNVHRREVMQQFSYTVGSLEGLLN